MKKITSLLPKILWIVLLCVSSQTFSQDRIAILQEPFVVLLDPEDGTILNPTFIDLSPLSQGTPKALLQVNNQIWITDQIEDRIDRFDLEGNYLSTISGGLDNIRGLELVNSSEVWVTNAGAGNGAPGNAIVRFDLAGNNLGFYAGTGTDTTFDIIDVGGEVYISYIGPQTKIERRDYNGNVLGNIVGTGVVNFIQQMEVNTTNSSVYAAVFSTSGGNPSGLYEFSIANGSILNYWGNQGSLRGVAQLGDGNILISNGSGVYILDPNTGTTNSISGSSSQYFGRLQLSPCTPPPTPTGDATQTFNEGATIDDIVVDPSDVTWFATEADALAGTNPLPPGTLLVDGATYYAVNIVSGCLSAPFAVTVTILCTTPPTPTGDSNQSFVDGATIEDIVVDPTDVTWFPTENDALNSTNPLPPGTLLVDGETYWAVNIVNDCKSTPFPVTVSVCTIPAAPTGDTEQTLAQGATIEDIVVNPADVTWFATENDALNNTNPLPVGTILVDGATYWAASINGICVSEPLGVTITLLLGISEFEQFGITIYPNPASDILVVTSEQFRLTKISIYNILGAKVMDIKSPSNENTLSIAQLMSGIYIVQVQMNEQRFSTKLIKN